MTRGSCWSCFPRTLQKRLQLSDKGGSWEKKSEFDGYTTQRFELEGWSFSVSIFGTCVQSRKGQKFAFHSATSHVMCFCGYRPSPRSYCEPKVHGTRALFARSTERNRRTADLPSKVSPNLHQSYPSGEKGRQCAHNYTVWLFFFLRVLLFWAYWSTPEQLVNIEQSVAWSFWATTVGWPRTNMLPVVCWTIQMFKFCSIIRWVLCSCSSFWYFHTCCSLQAGSDGWWFV